MALDKLTKLGIIGAAGAYLYLNQDEAPGAPGETLQQRVARIKAPIVQRYGGQYSGTPDPKYKPPSVWESSDWSQEIIDALRAELAARWDKLSATAKREACASLKEQFPEDPGVQSLQCETADLDKVIGVVGIAAVGIACGPGAPVCSGLGIVAVVIFGDDLSDWIGGLFEREGIGGPIEEIYWKSVCQAAEDGNENALTKVLSDEYAPKFCYDNGYNLGFGTKV